MRATATKESKLGRIDNSYMLSGVDRISDRLDCVLRQDIFHAMLALERRRAERSRKPFALMLVDAHALPKNGKAADFLQRLTSVVCGATRESDMIGWYEENDTLAIIFTEINMEAPSLVTDVLHSKVIRAIRENLEPEIASRLIVTLHLYPESWHDNGTDRIADIKLYPDISAKVSKKKQSTTAAKRAIDIAGSAILLMLLSPALAVIAVIIKLTSKGPVIFAQERLGQFGKSFKCFKFRTMYVDSDPKIHREFVQQFIAGQNGRNPQGEDEPIYKITNDPRITPIGRFLRRTSLDEFPQFLNVLRGEMSLVGPRPPVPYEFEQYDFWHRRRVHELKPGVTGLWQISGRSRTSFNDMVRLDLRYSQSWSLWLDLKILLATPWAVLTGDGAF